MLGDRDYYYARSKSLIDDVEAGRKTAVVSYLVMMETIHVLRKVVVEQSRYAGHDRAECSKTLDPAESLVNRFVHKIKKLSKERKVIIARPDKKIHEHHYAAMAKLRDCLGYVRVISLCPYCKTGRVGREDQNKCPACDSGLAHVRKYQYKALSHPDIEHAYLARYSSAASFHSADTSFRDLGSDPDFDPMGFEIIPPPPKEKN